MEIIVDSNQFCRHVFRLLFHVEALMLPINTTSQTAFLKLEPQLCFDLRLFVAVDFVQS